MLILVAYATDHGSTRTIAERIAARLEGAGLPARALPVGPDIQLGQYSAVILGSAIHNGLWLPEGSAWARDLSPLLAGMPIWLFSVSSVGDQESAFPPRLAAFMRRARKTPNEIVELRQLLRARGHRNFAGVIDGHNWSRLGRLFMTIFRGRTGDLRNWPAIDAWALEIAAELKSRADSAIAV